MRCCECKKIIWPTQQSTISFSPIHQKCHQALISNRLEEYPEMRANYLVEVIKFEAQTGLSTGLKT